MLKKIFIIMIRMIVIVLPVIILVISFFNNKLYNLNINTSNYTAIMSCLELDNIDFKNTTDLKKIEVSKPTFSDTEEFKFYYSDNKIYYKYINVNDNSNLKEYIQKNCFDISNFVFILFISSCIVSALLILNPIIKYINKVIVNLLT